MKLRTKTFLVVGVVLLVVLVAAALVQRSVVQSGYDKVESHDVQQNSERIKNAMDHNLELLAFGTRFNSVWDDPYEDVENGDREAMETDDYPAADSFSGYGLSAVLVLDQNGKLLAGGSTDGSDSYGPAPASLSTPEAVKPLVFTGDELDKATCGLWQDPSGILQACSHAILHTDGSGPAAATLVNIKKLDESAIAALAKRTNLDVKLPSAELAKAAPKVAGDQPGLSWKAADAKHIDAMITLPALNDANGAPLAVSMSRPVHEQGTKAMNLSMITLALAGVVLVITMLVALSLIVLRRLSLLTKTAHHIAETGSLDERVDVVGKDELADLASTFNSMLDTVKAQDEAIRGAASDVASVLGKVAGGDLRVRIPSGHEGDFKRIEQSINDVLAKLENDFTGVRGSAEDVLSTATNIGQMREILVGAFDEQIDILQDAERQMSTLDGELEAVKTEATGAQIQTVQSALGEAVAITDANSAVSSIASDATANLSQHAERLQTIVSHYRLSDKEAATDSDRRTEEVVG